MRTIYQEDKMSQRSEKRQAQTLITDRVDDLNQCLNIICDGRIEAIPIAASLLSKIIGLRDFG